MKKITLAFLFFLLQTQSGLFAQLDPSLMSKLSQLSPQQRQQLMTQKSIGGTQPGGLAPTTDLKTRAWKWKHRMKNLLNPVPTF